MHRHVSLCVVKGNIEGFEKGSSEHDVVREFILILPLVPLNEEIALSRLVYPSLFEQCSVRQEVRYRVIELDVQAKEI